MTNTGCTRHIIARAPIDSRQAQQRQTQQFQQRQESDFQTQQTIQGAISRVEQMETQWRATNPDYAAIHPHIKNEMKTIAEQFPPTMWPRQVELLYNSISRAMASQSRPQAAFAQQQHWDFSTAHVQGHPPDAIAAYANETKPDLIIMGSHGHSALGSIIMGSTTSGVLARCAIPVLLVR